jgi:hypothetical protein
VKKLVANEFTQTLYDTQMESSEAMFALMKENNYQTTDFDKFTYKENSLSFVLKKDITYTKKVDVKPTTLTIEIVGPLKKEKDLVELTHFSYYKNKNGEDEISKEKISELIEKAVKGKEKQEYDFKPDNKTMKELGFKHQLTLKVSVENGVVNILAKETVEYQKNKN